MAEAFRADGHQVTEAAIEFTDPHYGKKFSKRPMAWPIAKIVSMLPAQVRRKTGEISIPPEAQEGDYDLIVIGSPTWWLTTCVPIRSYLQDPGGQAHPRGQALRRPTRPLAVTTRATSRRSRAAGEASGGTFIDATHFVADGNQVMSMWSWLAFMRHDKARERSFGIRMPRPNLKADYDQQAVSFISGVADRVLPRPAEAGRRWLIASSPGHPSYPGRPASCATARSLRRSGRVRAIRPTALASFPAR